MMKSWLLYLATLLFFCSCWAQTDKKIEIPAPIKNGREMILKRKAYTVSYNPDLKIPNWVAWHLTAEHTEGPYHRMANFHEDEQVPAPRAML